MSDGEDTHQGRRPFILSECSAPPSHHRGSTGAQHLASGHPVATIKAIHTGANASKSSPDDAGGLEPIICIAQGARIMLTSNLWVDTGLVNGAIGTVAAICYRDGQAPSSLPISVMVKFDSYSGPTYPDSTVPICPVRRSWSMSGTQCSRLQLPLKLAWAVTIHKAQGLTLDTVVIHVGKKEFSSGLSYVACSRVWHLNDLLFDPPFPFQRLANLSRSQCLQERLREDSRLLHRSSGYNYSRLYTFSNSTIFKFCFILIFQQATPLVHQFHPCMLAPQYLQCKYVHHLYQTALHHPHHLFQYIYHPLQWYLHQYLQYIV